MIKSHVFLTGATGCVGHYVLNRLLKSPQWHVHILVRDRGKLRLPDGFSAQLSIHDGNLNSIEALQDIVPRMDYVVHLATDWSDSDEAFRLNVEKTVSLFNMCHNDRCKKVLYFSTASILGRDNAPLEQAEKIGTGYIRSKFTAYRLIKALPIRHKLITLFPTLVFGGDAHHPYSHVSAGILPNQHFLKILRFFYLDGKFHWIHAKDIAVIVEHLLTHPEVSGDFVLGQPAISVRDAIQVLCELFQVPLRVRIRLSSQWLVRLAGLCRIQLSSWDLFCIKRSNFLHDTVTPESFGKNTFYRSLKGLLQELKIQHS